MSERAPLLNSRTSATEPTSRPSTTADSTGQDSRAVHAITAARGSGLGIALFVLLFLSTCNISVLTTIQSSIVTDLNATPTESSWFVSAFLIASAGVLSIAGKLCQIFNHRTYLFWSVVLEAVGLLLSGLASDAITFLLSRILYGCGVAALAPVAVILVRLYAAEKHHGTLFGIINCGYTTGLACGAILGGYLEPVVGWRALFWMQSPIVLLLAVATYMATPAPDSHTRGARDDLTIRQKLSTLDVFGTVTIITSVTLLLYSLSAAHLLVRPLVLSFACLALFVFVECKWASDPIIPPAVLRSRAVMLTGLATIGVMSARWAVLFYMPTYAIAVRQWSPGRAGTLLVPTNVGFGSGGVIVGWLHVRKSKSYYISSLVCFVLFALSETSISMLSVVNSPAWSLILALFLNGFVMGALLVYSLAHVLFLTDPADVVIVIAINAMFRAMSGAFGSSISGGFFFRRLQAALHHTFDEAGLGNESELISQLISRPILVQHLSGPEKDAAVTSYSSALQSVYLAGTALVLVMLVLQAGTGWSAPQPAAGKLLLEEERQ